MNTLNAVVGDNEFWLLAKRVLQAGGVVSSSDTVYTLQAQLTNIGASGTGGGGIAEAPTDGGVYERQNSAWVDTAVHKSGDTMTGQLVINAAEGLSTTGNVRLTGRGNILQFDSNISFIQLNSADGSISWQLSWNGMGIPKILGDSATGDLRLQSGTANHGIQITDATVNIALRVTAGGDLVATEISGPNAGKSVNLTSGKWA